MIRRLSLALALLALAGPALAQSKVDDSAFAYGTNSVMPLGCGAATDTMDANDVGLAYCGQNRKLDVDLGDIVAEDAAGGASPSGLPIIMQRRDTLTITEVGSDLDYVVPKVTSKGEVYVKQTDTVPVSGTLTITEPMSVEGIDAHDAATDDIPVMGGGYASAAAPTSVSADGDKVNAWFLRNGAQATVLTAAGALIGGDATNGLKVDVTRLSDGGNVISVDGAAANDAALSGNPVAGGGRASDARPTEVSADDEAVWSWHTRGGAQVVAPLGTENFTSGQVSCANTATSIASARVLRRSIALANHGTTDVYIGSGTVATNTGLLLRGNSSMSIPTAAALSCIVATGTQTISYMEVYE